jgi:hypothetical protein
LLLSKYVLINNLQFIAGLGTLVERQLEFAGAAEQFAASVVQVLVDEADLVPGELPGDPVARPPTPIF